MPGSNATPGSVTPGFTPQSSMGMHAPQSNSSLYPMTPAPMTPLNPATPASEGSGIVPQLQLSDASFFCGGHLQEVVKKIV